MAFLVKRSVSEVAFEPSTLGSSIGAGGYVTVDGFGASNYSSSILCLAVMASLTVVHHFIDEIGGEELGKSQCT